MKKTKIPLTTLCLCAFFAGLSIVLSIFRLPIGPVPINFTHTSIFAAVGLLGFKYGVLSQVVFVLVYIAITGIQPHLAGFVVGYVACAVVTGLCINRFGRSVKSLIPAMYAGWVVTYLLGVPWFTHVLGLNLGAALPLAMFPFLIGDAVKTFIAVILINRLYPVVQKMGAAG